MWREIRKIKATLLRVLIFLKSGSLEYHRKSNFLLKIKLKKGTKMTTALTERQNESSFQL